jgi:hypothetical protein
MHEEVHHPIVTGELQHHQVPNAANGTTNLAHEEYESPNYSPRELLLLLPPNT